MDYCLRRINNNLILPDLQAGTKKEVLLEMAAAIHQEYPQLDTNALVEILSDREQLGSTGIGDGIAIPHGKIGGLTGITVCFGRSIEGIPFDAPDGKPTFLFFLLIAPENIAEPYLSCLAELTRFLKSTFTRNRLLQAEDRETLLSILNGES